jgi:hypothetical protein
VKTNQAGKVDLGWIIDETGRVSKIMVVEDKTSLKDKALHTCLMDTVKSWTFPAAPKGQEVKVIYPFSISTE